MNRKKTLDDLIYDLALPINALYKTIELLLKRNYFNKKDEQLLVTMRNAIREVNDIMRKMR